MYAMVGKGPTLNYVPPKSTFSTHGRAGPQLLQLGLKSVGWDPHQICKCSSSNGGWRAGRADGCRREQPRPPASGVPWLHPYPCPLPAEGHFLSLSHLPLNDTFVSNMSLFHGCHGVLHIHYKKLFWELYNKSLLQTFIKVPGALFLQSLQMKVFLKISGFIILKEFHAFVRHLRIYKEICAPFREVFFNKNYPLQCQWGFISDLDIEFLNTLLKAHIHTGCVTCFCRDTYLHNPITNMSKASSWTGKYFLTPAG